VAAGALQGKMLWAVDIDDKGSCGKWFVRNVWTGGLIFLGCLGEWIWETGAGGLSDWLWITG